MKISVEALSGDVFSFECESNDTIADLLKRASTEEGVPSQQLMLTFHEEEMEGTKTLAAAFITEESRLHLKLRAVASAAGEYVIFLCLILITYIFATQNNIYNLNLKLKGVYIFKVDKLFRSWYEIYYSDN